MLSLLPLLLERWLLEMRISAELSIADFIPSYQGRKKIRPL